MNSRTNLPPGCLPGDLDPKMVTCPECDGLGFNDECGRCGGSGEIPASTVCAADSDRDDWREDR